MQLLLPLLVLGWMLPQPAVAQEIAAPDGNTRRGRDHHPKVFNTLLAGGPVRGGMIHGASDKGQVIAEVFA